MAAAEAMEVDEAPEIDESLYSRQLYVMGREGQVTHHTIYHIYSTTRYRAKSKHARGPGTMPHILIQNKQAHTYERARHHSI